MANPAHAIQAVNEALQAYLQTAVTDLAAVLTEWPQANQVIAYPSVTLFTVNPQYRGVPPLVIAKTDPDVNNNTTVTYYVGEWDYTLQLDLWAGTKLQRDTLLGELASAINSNPGGGSTGLALRLTAYYNEWVHLDIDAQKYVQDEQAAERREWRGLITLLVNVRAIQTQVMYAIKSLEVDYAATVNDSDMTDDLANTTQEIIF